MPQVITPPSAGMQEEAAKNWHRAEALRRINNDLARIVGEIPEETHYMRVRDNLLTAVGLILAAKRILAPDPVAPDQPPTVPLARRKRRE